MADGPDTLYALLPAIYRERDAGQNYRLRALLRILGSQASLADADIRQLYENLFIETCDSWVIPYIGDLVSNNLLYDPSRRPPPDTAKALFPDLAGKDLLAPVAIRIRADVAKTIFYRRRKSTPAMLEQMARDVTGWPAYVVEFFQLLGWTQFLEHQRPLSQWTDLRSTDRMERIYGPFDQTSYTVDVRPPSQQEGWYNIRNLGCFLWRLESFKLDKVPARLASAPWRYHFSPLGNPAPLFTQLRQESEGSGLVTEIDISGPIRRTLFHDDLATYANAAPPRPDFAELYGPFEPTTPGQVISSDTSLYIVLGGQGVDPGQDPDVPPAAFIPQIVCRVLLPWPAVQPTGKIIAVDVEHGRLAVGDGWGMNGPVDVSYYYGFSSGLGGGTYDRQKWLENRSTLPAVYTVQQSGGAGVFTTVTAAIAQWVTDNRPNAIVSILDSRTYQLPGSITLRNEGSLAIEAANEQRPLLEAPAAGLQIDVSAPVDPALPDRNASITLSGVVVEGFVEVVGDLGQLRLLHSTLIPGRQLDENGGSVSTLPSLIVADTQAGQPVNLQLRVEAAFSILGQATIPETCDGIWLLDCIVRSVAGNAICDANGEHSAPLLTERSTFFGKVLVKSLQASEAVFTELVDTERTQGGCVRFSYLVPGSRTPRRFHCQPDLAESTAIGAALETNPALTQAQQTQIRNDIEAWLVPSFTTASYGMPAFAQLHLACPAEIRKGAEDGSEMGAFCHLKQPQRESNLRVRFQEYLPFGLEAAIIYVT